MIRYSAVRLLAFLTLMSVLAGCNRDNVITGSLPPVINFDNGTGMYSVVAGEELVIAPVYTNVDDATTYRWTLDGRVIGDGPQLCRVWEDVGEHYVILSVRSEGGSASEEVLVEVTPTPLPGILLPLDGDALTVRVDSEYKFAPVFTNADGLQVRWIVDGEPVSDEREYTYRAGSDAGTHTLVIEAANSYGTSRREISIDVVAELPVRLEFLPLTNLSASTMRYTFAGRGVYLSPFTAGVDASGLEWSVDGLATGHSGAGYMFVPSAPGEYVVTVTAAGRYAASVTVVCVSVTEDSRFRAGSVGTQTRVFEYMPAPGQFINDTGIGGMTGAETTPDAAAQWAQRRMERGTAVSLGGFGGYIVVGFDHSIPATAGEFDFSVLGNAFLGDNTGAGTGGSNEPGIVYVMQDVNGNGLPDDEWYELRGSEDDKAVVQYAVTYFRPQGVRLPVMWLDSRGSSGSIDYIADIHPQESYYPAWIQEDSYTLYGTCLPAANYQEASGLWVNPPFGWGYADNYGSDVVASGDDNGTGQRNGFSISRAVYPDRTPVKLKYIDFIKVQTGVNSKSGHLGELSTEVCGFEG